MAGAMIAIRDIYEGPPKDEGQVVVDAPTEPEDVDRDGVDLEATVVGGTQDLTVPGPAAAGTDRGPAHQPPPLTEHRRVVQAMPRRGTPVAMTRVLVAVDDSEGSVRAAETAHRLFGDDAEYLAVNVTNVVDLATIPWYGAGWGAPYAAPYGAVWAYRNDVVSGAERGRRGRGRGQRPGDRRRVRDCPTPWPWARRATRRWPCCGPPRSATST